MALPIKDGKITCEYKRRGKMWSKGYHTGCDFAVPVGTEVLAVADAQATAMKEVWTRLYDRVKHMAEKLADPKSIFRDTLVENLQEQCTMLSRLNFMDDPNLEALRQQVEGTIASHHPDALRNDPDLRRDTAAEAKAIMDKMSVFMGV